MPANRVGTRVHYVWFVNAASNAEAEHVLADAAAPIRLRRRAHGAHGDGTESLFRLVLLDVIGKRELRATDRCLLVEPVGRARQTNQPACTGAPNAMQKPAAINASTEPRQYDLIGTPPSPVPRAQE